MIAIPSQTTINHSDIEEIVGKATFLFEHLNNDYLPDANTQLNVEELNTRLARWCKVMAQGNWEQFQKRIEWEGWNIECVNHVLGTQSIFNHQPLPEWANTLNEIIKTVSGFSWKNIYSKPIDPNQPYPFEDVLLPLCFVARQKLLRRLGCNLLSSDTLPLSLITESAYLKLEQSLLQRLVNISANSLDYEFSHSRPLGKNLLSLIIKKNQSVDSKEQYNNFVNKLLADGLLGLFKKYPVLSRFIATTIDFWVEATAQFLERLNADLYDIKQLFSQDDDYELGKVIEIQSGLSDLHNQNRSVISLTFASGLKLIYKPKNLDLEVTYCQFLEWCNQNFELTKSQGLETPQLDFKILKILSRHNYGWVEYVEQQPCKDEAAAQRFYIRAGMLLCLLYLLSASDCHYENLIACGEHLVLIDMETVMHHQAKAMEDLLEQTATSVANEQLSDSVLTTGMLPMWDFSADKSVAFDLSGLGSVESQPTPIPIPVWKFINTDDMQQGFEKMNRPLQKNIPMLNGMPLSPNDYIDYLVSGFEQMYRFFVRYREVLLKPESILSAFRSQQVRFIFRPTRIYGRILGNALSPQFLSDGRDWSIEVDFLSRAFLFPKTKPLAWQVLGAELRAVELLDVPYFNAVTGSDTLTLNEGQKLIGYFQQPSYDDVLTRLQRLSEADLAVQVGIIQLAFYARVAKNMQAETIDARDITEDVSVLTSAQLEQEAENIAREIAKRAIAGNDGSLSWIGLNFDLATERYQLQPLSNSLYDGNCGIALFLAAFARCTGNTQFGDLALRSIQLLQKSIQAGHTEVEKMGIGGATGLPSIIYSLVKIGQFLELPQLLEDAQRTVNLITPTAIAQDSKFDIVGGAAGAILGLLALYEVKPDAETLQRARECGQHLLKYCHAAYVLKNTSKKPLTGYSHGAAGIAYALLRLYSVTGDRTYLEAAHQAIAYENSFFFPNPGNWQEILPINDPTAAPVFWSTWCHGAPGIALGRLGGLSIEHSEQVLADIEVALQTTHKTGLQNIDQICCGNFGRSEILLVAAQKLSHPQWYQHALELASMSVQQAKQIGNYQYFGNLPPSIFHPCFFQGAAGIGYQLLRLAYPEVLPSVLLWQ
ncbi:lanthionine synthetase C family protein [Nostoc sp. NIES-3756]|uniref:type 2 lanthipeptide synthetase LanM family protein n=1 Tax=Nostoc sp. NIES-3756 TaxID=1751286 RepID=UPI00071F8E41|nr:type 2 lanthipeptide synthetase LanM family protein [Nostoc sp. NIES-3756]BAT55579.1 lanthionine synthetase C family protein [Nostoc sp. NIES-3756]